MTVTELFDQLAALDLAAGEYAVFGSGPLAIRGLINDPNDLDILCRGETWERIRRTGSVETQSDGSKIVSFQDGQLTFGNTWAYGSFDIDDLIQSAEIIDGLPFVLMKHVVAYKEIRGNDRDQIHLELIASAGLV